MRDRFQQRCSSHPQVDACWTHASGPAEAVVIAADACVDVIVALAPSAPPRAWLDVPVPWARRSMIVGDATLMGVRLRRAHGGALRHHAARPHLLAAAGACHEVAELEQLLAGFLADAPPTPAIVEDFVGSLPRLGQLTSAARRRLERAVQHWLGLTPKMVQRIARADDAATMLGAGDAIVEVAANLGFADQAHLTRELVRLHGVTPGRLRRGGG